MKKTFRFLALSFALICGTLSSLAAAPAGGPAIGTSVGNTTGLGVVNYVVKDWNDAIELADGTKGAYEVEIVGLNFEGLQIQPKDLKDLTVPLAFKEQYGTVKPAYVVISIKATDMSEKAAFYAKTYLETLTFENDLTVTKAPVNFTIGAYSFYGCSKLNTLTFPDNVTEIGEYAFQDCAVVNFEIPANCTTIGEFAFYNCKKLNTVTVRSAKDKDGKEIGGALKALEGKVFANSTLETLNLEKAYQLKTIGSASASPFLYNLSDINDQLKTVKLPKAFGKAEVSNLTDVFSSFKNCTKLEKIENLEISVIDDFPVDAFNNCQSLEELNFPVGKKGVTMLTGSPFIGCVALKDITFAADFWGTIGDGSKNLFGVVNTDDASLAALKTITFKGYLNGTIKTAAFGATAANGSICTSLNTLTITNGLHGGYDGAAAFGATIDANAFSFCEALETVSLNGVTIDGADKDASDVTLAASSFTNTGIKNLNLGNIAITNQKAAHSFTLGAAFSSKALETVTIGTITLSHKAGAVIAHTVTINDKAFVGGENFTKFTVGNISNMGGSVTFGNGTSDPVAYSSDFATTPKQLQTLEEVTFHEIKTDKTVTISANAFKSDALTTVNIGDLKKLDAANNTAEAITINGSAFAAATPASSEVTSKTITIGAIAANTDIKAGAFTGATGAATKDTYAYAATIGNIKKAGTADFTLQIAAAAFAGPTYGNVTYTIGNIVDNADMSKIVAGAFVGAKDNATDLNKNTVVNIGSYEKAFKNNNTFTNVKELTAAAWKAADNLNRFNVPYKVTVTGDMTQDMYGDLGDKMVKEIDLQGNVTGKLQQFGEAVRAITFGTDKEVAKGAIAANAFEQAAASAQTLEETINITYQCSEGKEALYNPIFVETSFGTTKDPRVAVLFTTEWAKNNIFENTNSTTGYPNGINRLTISTSEVAPTAADVTAKVVAAKNGNYKYGKLYLPKGKNLKYKVDAKVSGSKNGVNVFSGHLDNDNIYMKQLDTYKGFYWIDATKADQVFVVRTSDMTATEITVEFVDDADELNDAKNYYWFLDTDANKNCLRYATSAVVNQELQNNAEFKGQTIYMMASPAKYNLAFAQLDQYADSKKDLPKNSIYVVSPTDPRTAAARLNVIFDDPNETEGNTTAIESVELENAQDGAIYNLQGVRVNKAGKGIYVINGKKVIR